MVVVVVLALFPIVTFPALVVPKFSAAAVVLVSMFVPENVKLPMVALITFRMLSMIEPRIVVVEVLFPMLTEVDIAFVPKFNVAGLLDELKILKVPIEFSVSIALAVLPLK